jgi:hypothetical protein
MDHLMDGNSSSPGISPFSAASSFAGFRSMPNSPTQNFTNINMNPSTLPDGLIDLAQLDNDIFENIDTKLRCLMDDGITAQWTSSMPKPVRGKPKFTQENAMYSIAEYIQICVDSGRFSQSGIWPGDNVHIMDLIEDDPVRNDPELPHVADQGIGPQFIYIVLRLVGTCRAVFRPFVPTDLHNYTLYVLMPGCYFGARGAARSRYNHNTELDVGSSRWVLRVGFHPSA